MRAHVPRALSVPPQVVQGSGEAVSYHLFRARDICAYIREHAEKANTLDDLEIIERVVANEIAKESEEMQMMIRRYTDPAVRRQLDAALARLAEEEGVK